MISTLLFVVYLLYVACLTYMAFDCCLSEYRSPSRSCEMNPIGLAFPCCAFWLVFVPLVVFIYGDGILVAALSGVNASAYPETVVGIMTMGIVLTAVTLGAPLIVAICVFFLPFMYLVNLLKFHVTAAKYFHGPYRC